MAVADSIGASAGRVSADCEVGVEHGGDGRAVSGVPSWNVMSGRTVMVHSVKSAFGVIDWARYGWAVLSTSKATSGS